MWYVTSREDYRLRVFEDRVFQGTCVSKREEVTRIQRKFFNEKLHNLYFCPVLLRRINQGG
jgi:hypothetical protein